MAAVRATVRQRGGEDRAFQATLVAPAIPEHYAPSLVGRKNQDTCARDGHAGHVCASQIRESLPSEPPLTGGGERGGCGGRSLFPWLFLTLSSNVFFWRCPPLRPQSPW